MVVIYSTSGGDTSTCDVIDWLVKKKQSFKRMNLNDIYYLNDISIHISSDRVKNQVKKPNVYWFRRGKSAIQNTDIVENAGGSESLISFQLNELDEIINYFLEENEKSYWLNKPFKSILNKLSVLDKAKEFFSIPNTLVTNSKSQLLKFKEKYKKIIVKPLSEGTHFTFEDDSYYQYTAEVKDEFINALEQEVFPCLIQEKIIKDFEIRSFFIEGSIYSMAIFSQRNKKTETDYRKYDEEKQNRCVPYKLTTDEAGKVSLLMKKLDLNSGSIDFIKSKTGDLVFLEVNPVGQFDMISKPCNYYLEERIAELLVQKSMKRNE